MNVTDKVFNSSLRIRFRPSSIEDDTIEVHSRNLLCVMKDLEKIRTVFPDAKIIYDGVEFRYRFYGIKLGDEKNE